MNRIVLPVILSIAVLFSYLYAEQINIVPYSEGDKCGYADMGMNIIVKPQYDACGEMTDGLASVRKKGKYGFIESTGKTVIPMVYSFSTSFRDGFAIMCKDDKYIVFSNRGDVVIPLTEYNISYYSYSSGVAIISQGNRFGLMGGDGRIILQVEYGEIKPGGMDFFIVEDRPAYEDMTSGKYYLYNSKGIKVVSDGYDIITPAAKGFMIIKSGNRFGYLHPGGAVIAPPVYDGIRNIKPDGTACFRKNGKWGIMNGQGKIIVSAQYEDVGGSEDPMEWETESGNNWCKVRAGGKWGIISLKGDIIAGTEYKAIGSGNSGYIPAYKEIDGSGSGVRPPGLTLLDSTGWELFRPKKEYNAAGEEGEGLLPAGRYSPYGNGKIMGYINHQGETVIPMSFEEAGQFQGGYAVVKKNGLYGITDKRGEMVEEAVYEYLRRSGNYPGLYEGGLNGKKVYLAPGGRHFWR